MTEFVMLCLPSLTYVALAGRRGRAGGAWRLCGLGFGAGLGYLYAVALLIPLGLLGWAASAVVPAEIASAPGVTVGATSPLGAVGVALRASGEEVFFRGFLGGLLVRRFGFRVGNLAQAALFLLPHFALLLVDVRLWPLLPIQFASGWVLGWLRHRGDSAWPGALVHALVNLAAGVV